MDGTGQDVIPRGCILSRAGQRVLEETLLQDEIPCCGCEFREKCPVSLAQEVNTADILGGGFEQPGVKCPRCKGIVTEWAIYATPSGSVRIWTCGGTIPDTGGIPCGWTMSNFVFSR